MSMSGGSTTVLAEQMSGGFVDGQGNVLMFYGAESFVVHLVTWVIYITDMGNNRIRTCTPSGNVGTCSNTIVTYVRDMYHSCNGMNYKTFRSVELGRSACPLANPPLV